MKYIFALFFIIQVATAQQTKFVDFKSAHAEIAVDHRSKSVSGSVLYRFDLLSKTDTIRIDAVNMQFANVKINGKYVRYKDDSTALILYTGFRKGENLLTFTYSAQPKQTMYFVQAGNDVQVWTQGQGKNTSHWFPSFDDTNEKVVFNISVSTSGNPTVISNGTFRSVTTLGSNRQWNFTMEHPMSSYLLMLAIGNFDRKIIKTASGIPLEQYIEREDLNKWEPTYRHSKQLFDFLETEIGVAYPWDVYKQIPVRDFLYAGMENTSATVFARDYVVDSIGYTDRNYVNVNAHELAHQWFGDMVTAKSGEHHWLQEGFATYYALLAERDVFGDDYFYMKMYDMAENLQRAATTDTIPILNSKASSLTFYQKGAWALHVLREGVGADKFRLAVRNYLNKHAFKNVETADFLREVNAVSNYDTNAFSARWLQKPGFEVTEALNLLKRNPELNRYLSVVEMAEFPYAGKRQIFEEIMQSSAPANVKEEILMQTYDVPFADKQQLIRGAMSTADIRVRQAVAKTIKEVPAEFLAEYESLISDKSYITQEIVLKVLWSQFPDLKPAILDKTSGRVGLNDKNIRILWLTLALATENYRMGEKTGYYDELLRYASPSYESTVRMNAIENLLFIDPADSNVLPHLVNATTHHKWQLTKYARDRIRLLLKKEGHRNYFSELLPKLPESEKYQLERLLKE